MNIQQFQHACQQVGVIDMGIDGKDEYLLIKDTEDEINIAELEKMLMRHFYRDATYPGGYFCHQITAMKVPFKNEAIVIIQHRFDV